GQPTSSTGARATSSPPTTDADLAANVHHDTTSHAHPHSHGDAHPHSDRNAHSGCVSESDGNRKPHADAVSYCIADRDTDSNRNSHTNSIARRHSHGGAKAHSDRNAYSGYASESDCNCKL